MKSWVKISLVVLLIVVVGLIVYFVWSAFSGPAPEVPADQGGGLPISGNAGNGNQSVGQTQPATSTQTSAGAVSKISENPVFDYWIDVQTKEIYYLNPAGQVFSAKNGQDIQITQQSLTAPNFIKLSPNSQRVLVAFGDPRLPQWAVFDVIDSVWRSLPNGITAATWSGDSDNLIAFVKNGSNVNLSDINVSQNQPTVKLIAKDIRFQDVNLDFLPPNNLLVEENPSAGYAGRVWNINLKDLSIHLMASPENGFSVKLSRDDVSAEVFSVDNGFRVLDPQTFGSLVILPFKTLPSKCSPDSDVIYCFVPQGDAFKGASLPDDYLQKDVYSSDSLYRIAATTGDFTPVTIPPNQSVGPIDAKDPYVSGGYLYFINRYDNALYSLSLGSGN